MPARPNFDLIAKPYRWLEYITLGRALERCRTRHLPQLLTGTRALVIGDGDGRFLAELMARNPAVRVTAVDASAAMLALLERRCASYADRLAVVQADALTLEPDSTYDLVVTHFFLDCLTQPELEVLATRLASRLDPESGRWVVSDFRIPPNGPMRVVATLIVTWLYLAFGMLTGMRVRRLPDHAWALTRAGLSCTARIISLKGLLVTELWSHTRPPAGA